MRYLIVIFCWEDRRNDPKAAVVKLALDIPEDMRITIVTEQSSSLKSIMNCGVFWPMLSAKAKFGEIQKSEITSHVHKGKKLTGVTKDGSYGNPMGTYRLEDEDCNKVSRVTDVASSATAMRGKQELQEIFAALQGRIAPVVTVVSKDGLAFAHIRMKEKLEVDDGLADVWSAPIVFGTKGGASSGSGRESVAGQGANTGGEGQKENVRTNEA